MNYKSLIGTGIIASTLTAIGLSTAPVQAATIGASDTGWYQGASHNPSNNNYGVGGYSGREYRNFFVFDLSGVSKVTSATLRAYLLNPNGYNSNDSSEIWNLWDVSTNLTNLTNGSGGIAAFNDLGSGNSYGSTNITSADMGSFVEVQLNAQALASLSAANGLWSVGGSITSLGSNGNEVAFAYSHTDPRVELVINEQEVPEPITILGSTIALGFGTFFKRKRFGKKETA